MDTFEKIAQKIVEEQELIVGPLAREEALRVVGVSIPAEKQLLLVGDKRQLIDQLVARYERLFGLASVQVCHEAAAPLLPDLKEDQVPSSLK